MSLYHSLGVLLNRLQYQLELHHHWQYAFPAQEALVSAAPFAIDHLSCTQWLQWIFIPKMQLLIEQKKPLPRALAIAPYAQQMLVGKKGQNEIMALLQEIDCLFNESDIDDYNQKSPY